MRKIIKEKPYSNYPEDEEWSIVLCQYNDMYVTWIRDRSIDMFHWGHYHNTMEGAERDFEKRGIKISEPIDSVGYWTKGLQIFWDAVTCREKGKKIGRVHLAEKEVD
jgi:hypothetical protein